MEKKHKDLLITKRCDLVENLNVRDGLFTQLISRKILNQRMVRTIKNSRTPDEQAEELLDILPTRGPECFQRLCEALVADDQEHIVNEYLTPDIQTSKLENEDLNLKKRKRSPSPTTLQIKDTQDGKLFVKFLSAHSSEKILCAEKTQFDKGDLHFSLKHFISQPDANIMEYPRYIPVPTGPRVMEGSHYISVPLRHSDTSQCTETNPTTPDRLIRCDSIDAMKHFFTKPSPEAEVSVKRESNSLQLESDNPISVERKEDCCVILKDIPTDNDIDLTDGPVNVDVQRSTRQFYLANYKQSYPMKIIPRGKAIIINVNEVHGKSARKGTDIDRDNLHLLLLQLHFEVIVYNDKDGLTAKELFTKLQKFAALKEHEESNACFVCLLSHGEEGSIFGTDGNMIALDTIFNLFNNNKCQSLRGKPKLFIIQACRGGSFDRGVNIDETDGGPMVSKQLPTLSDMIIGYPTQAGYYAWRNREKGSWYIEAIVHVFMKHAKHDDICTLFHRVNSVVSKKMSKTPNINMDQMSQMSEYKSSLRWPHLYLFPGIGSA